MKRSAIQNVLQHIVADMIDKNFQKLFENDHGKRLTAQEIKEGVEDHPGIITALPDEAFSLMRLYRDTDTNCDVDIPLWYDHERSDLTMVRNIKLINKEYRYTIEDILVQ